MLALSLTACSGWVDTRKEIEGNNTGGVIPRPLLGGGANAQALADAHCAKWGSRARITFAQAEAAGDVVFVCEGWSPGVAPAPAPGTKQPPASKPQSSRTS